MLKIHRSFARIVRTSLRYASISKSILDALPQSVNTDSAWSEIRSQLKQDNRRLVVLDDDPTGCQTVYDVNVLLDYSVESIEKQLERDDKLFYILTNTRALTENKAKLVIKKVLDNLTLAATHVIYPHELQIISRGDSTLRGHFPAEIDAIKERLAVHATILCPAFFEGGRVTLNDTHYVIEGDRLTPAGETAFAKDAHFGFTQSNLKDWVEEKTKGAVRREDVVSISLEDLRTRDSFHVTNKMEALTANENVIIVNAVNQHDLNSFVLALIESERNGFRYLYRTAASFVASRAGLEPRRLLNLSSSQNSSSSGKRTGGLIVVGSYVPKTTTQLQVLLNTTNVFPVELNVADVLKAARSTEQPRQGDELSPALRDLADNMAREVVYQLYCGKDVVLYTSRGFAEGAELVDTADVSKVVCAIVKQIVLPLPFLVAKGGITSHDVAQHGLGMTSALVLGQVEPGVPVWRAGAESRFPHLNYVVFPGNVGDDDALARVAMKLGVRRKVHQGNQPLFSQSTTKLITILREAKRNESAIAAFNIYNVEGAKAVVAAAEIMQVPVILQVHPASLDFGGRPLLDLLKAFKRYASVPVFVSLDHAEKEGDIDVALQCGVDAVMVDGSARSFEDNMRWTAKMVSWVHESDAIAEAELGRLAGNEDGLSVDLRDAKMTDPVNAGLFARETKVNLLAVTIGNVHGPYALEPQLDFPRLEAIRSALPADMPLVLHGASGLGPDLIRGAITRGVCKFNVNTDMREAALRVQQDTFNNSGVKKVDTLELMRNVTNEMSRVAIDKMQLFSNNHKFQWEK